MNLFDEPDLLCDYMNHVFITSDDSGTCEAVLPQPRRRVRPDGFVLLCSDSDIDSPDKDKDDKSLSPDIRLDRKHRMRSNTAVMLDKLQEDKERCNPCSTVSWKRTLETELDYSNIFCSKPIAPAVPLKPFTSLATKMIRDSPEIGNNQFIEFAQFETLTNGKWFLIFLPGLLAEDKRLIPMKVSVSCSAKVWDLLGLVCFKYTMEGRKPSITNQSNHALFMAEENGEVEMDLPPLNNQESIARIGFSCLALQALTSSSVTEKLPTLTIYFTNEEKYIIEIVKRDETMASVRDKVLALRSKANAKDYTSFDYGVESVAQPYVTFQPSATVLSTQRQEFLLIRKNCSRGDFDPHHKVADVVDAGEGGDAPLSPMCFFYSVTMKVSSKGYLPTQLVVCSDRIEMTTALTSSVSPGRPHQRKSSFIFPKFRKHPKSPTSNCIALNCVGGVQVFEEQEGRKSFRIVHISESSAANLNAKNSPSKVHWTSHNFDAPIKIVDEISVRLGKLLDTKPSATRTLFVNRSQLKRKPSLLKRVTAFSPRTSHVQSKMSAACSSLSDPLANAYQINDDWMQ